MADAGNDDDDAADDAAADADSSSSDGQLPDPSQLTLEAQMRRILDSMSFFWCCVGHVPAVSHSFEFASTKDCMRYAPCIAL